VAEWGETEVTVPEDDMSSMAWRRSSSSAGRLLMMTSSSSKSIVNSRERARHVGMFERLARMGYET
jgi:hypothetical protein